MTLSYKHAFVSAKTDGTDASVLRPSDWNAEHTITCATNVILGRNTAGTGAVEELATSDAVIALLASATLADLLTAMGVSPPTTGDARLTLKTTATTGWVMLNDGTIGDASSGASRANADTLALWTLIYTNLLDADAPIYSPAGVLSSRAGVGDAASGYAAHYRISLPKALGRAIIVAGAGSGLTSRALASYGGVETHALTEAELRSHTHTFSGTGTSSGATNTESAYHTHTQQGTFTSGAMSANASHTHSTPAKSTETAGHQYSGGSSGADAAGTTGSTNTDHTHAVTISGQTSTESALHLHTYSGAASVSGTTAATGSSTAHPNMQPFSAWNVMVKL